MRALGRQQRPRAPDPSAVVGGAIRVLAVHVAVVAVPGGPARRFDAQRRVDDPQGVDDAGIVGCAQAEAHQKLAVVFNHAQSYEAAAREFEKEVALEPDVAAGHLYLGAAYVQLKKVAEAERELLKAYELAGKAAASAQLLLGQLYYGQQKFELAQRAFEQYLSDMPNAQNAAQVKQAVEQIKALLKAK